MLDKIIHKWLNVPYTLHVRRRTVTSPKSTLVFLHGIGNSSEAWNEVIDRVPDQYEIITIDLLGFGNSPRPIWAKYDAHTQARSVAATLIRLGKVRPVTVVGHSLGALVAVEMAKVYGGRIKALVLASPPFYIPEDHPRGIIPNADIILRSLYRNIKNRPERFVRMANFAMKHRLTARSFNVTQDNVAVYMTALEAMIINQTSYQDAAKLRTPTYILHGTLDPFVVSKNLRNLKKLNSTLHVRVVAAGHEVRGLYVSAVIKAIIDATSLDKSKV